LVNLTVKSFLGLITLFLSMPYKPISFFTAYKAFLAGSLIGVYFYIGVAAWVTGGT